jgi:hypothetical protein
MYLLSTPALEQSIVGLALASCSAGCPATPIAMELPEQGAKIFSSDR